MKYIDGIKAASIKERGGFVFSSELIDTVKSFCRMPIFESSNLESVESNKNESNQVPINLNDAEFIVAAHKPSHG